MEKTNGQNETENIQRMSVALENMGTVNKNQVIISINGKGTLTLYFSYKTIVSFELSTPHIGMTETIKNYWSNTTGKLLNELEPNKDARIDENTFNKCLCKAFNELMGC